MHHPKFRLDLGHLEGLDLRQQQHALRTAKQVIQAHGDRPVRMLITIEHDPNRQKPVDLVVDDTNLPGVKHIGYVWQSDIIRYVEAIWYSPIADEAGMNPYFYEQS